MAKKKKNVKVGKIKGVDIVMNSSNKMNRSMPEVSTGCGSHGKKKYSRKKKHKSQD